MTIYEKIVRMNRYYKLTKFYDFLSDIAFKGLLSTIFFFGALFIVDYFLVDINHLLNFFVESYSTPLVISFFYLSETLLGLVPPEIFMAWAAKSDNALFLLFLLATASYVGGVTAYFIGTRIRKIPAIHDHIKFRLAKHLVNLRKWGGFLVVVGAMLPIPHAIVSIACGFMHFKTTHYLLWALFRYLRFFIYGMVIFRII